MRKRTSRWLLAGAVLLGGYIISSATSRGAGLTPVVAALLWLWALITLAVGAWKIWRWLTYRVGVRLFISYLLLGVTPFLFCGAFAGLILYMFMGQYTSVRYGDLMLVRMAQVRARAERVLEVADSQGRAAALAELSDLEGEQVAGFPRVLWMADLGAGVRRGPGAEDLRAPSWVDPSIEEVIVRSGGAAYWLGDAVSGDGARWVAALVPLDGATAHAISGDEWFQVAFTNFGEPGGDAGDEPGMNATLNRDEHGYRLEIHPGTAGLDGLWEAWPDSAGGAFNWPFVVWFRMPRDVLDLATGQAAPKTGPVSLLRTSPANVWQDFTLSRYELGSELRGAVLGLGVFFVILYGIAFLMAALMIVSITRSTARLSRGARAVEHGDLDHRIAVKRRDQLGDLAISFNSMTQSVQGMLAAVAEKERLARELELAREIQESLLPARHLQHGPLTVHATFRPAQAVGGDYFDLFPLAENRLALVVGDVAGHGLHTGLLMAGLKSSVAALVHEGYEGADLVRRLNHLLVGQGREPTMVTLAVLELEPGAERARLTNAGHPPPYLLSDGSVRELLLGSLPLGNRLSVPRQTEIRLPPSSLLVLYSDGLVEAADAAGEPFGYDRLMAVLAEGANLNGAELSTVILAALDRHTGGGPLADDLMLIIVEHLSQPEGVAEPDAMRAGGEATTGS